MKKHASTGEAILVHPYERVAKRLRIARLVLVFLLVAFLLGGLLLLREDFTAENLRFLMRDLSFDSPSLGLDASALSFDYDTSQKAALYHGDLALLRRSGLDIYSFSGSRSLSEEFAFSSPALLTGDKYLVAYDIGGNKLSVYNSFSKLHTETFDFPVSCADLNDDGVFAVVSAEKGYHSALYLFNTEFERTFRYCTSDSVIYDVALCRENSERVAVATVYADDGDYLTRVLVIDTARAEVTSTYTFVGEMPLDLSYASTGNVTLVTDSGLHRISLRADKVSSHAFYPEELANFYSDSGYDVLLKNSGIIGTTLDVLVFTPDSDTPVTTSITTQVQSIKVADGNVYLLSHDALSVFHLSDQKLSTYSLSGEYKDILPLSGSRIAFVGEGSVAIYMVG